ncbi:EamA family transporter [Methylobacter sp.]|uniref:EamA family transporter n=1 Tax=Methylobacter sp. TaxID=2051955 RepID=UPI0024887586|nr:EamA family transporter [Methylobacter sp.]MDI1276636.1 EamA family transporter [Methylobacter sp.]MDI1357257.1 EamA family transporter [Methylobacter sp.]
MLDRGRLIILACVAVMTIGQILFKLVATNYNKTESLFDWGVLGVLIIAGVLYITSTGLWVWALRTVEISRAYPYFALGFVFVPLLGAWMFGEILSLRYGLGVILIIAGVVLTSTS